MKIARRLGRPPHERSIDRSTTNGTCPDIFELDDGRIAVIGTDCTEKLDNGLPPHAARADDERIVVITRETFVRACEDIVREVLPVMVDAAMRVEAPESKVLAITADKN